MYRSSSSGVAGRWQAPDDPPRGRQDSSDGHLGRRDVLWLAVAAVAVLVVIGGAFAWDQYRATQQDVGDCAIGVDLTSLVDDDTTPVDERPVYRDRYLGWTEEILRHCIGAGASRLVVFPIAVDTGARDLQPVARTFLALDPDRDQGVQTEERAEWIEAEALPGVEELLDSELVGTGTDILSGVDVAEDELRDDVDFRWLWLLTDGIHNEGGGVNVRNLRDDDHARDEVDRLVAEGRFDAGALDGVEVHVFGAGAGGQSARITDDQKARIQVFWEELFDMAGASLEYSTGGPELTDD